MTQSHQLFESFIPDDAMLKDGVWESSQLQQVSYPDEAYGACYQIEDDSFWFLHRNRCIDKVVKKYTDGGLFFDIGGGNGYVARFLQDQDIETVLIEPSRQACQNASKRGVKSIICCGLEDINTQKSKISSIGLFDVLEHIEDDCAFLKNIFNLLDDSGKVFLTVPAHSWLWSHEDAAAGHFRRYTKKSLKQVFEKNGFNIIFATYFFEILVFPILFLRRIPHLLGRNHQGYQNNQVKSDHSPKGNGILNKILQFELDRLFQSNIFTGTSLIVVAEKSS